MLCVGSALEPQVWGKVTCLGGEDLSQLGKSTGTTGMTKRKRGSSRLGGAAAARAGGSRLKAPQGHPKGRRPLLGWPALVLRVKPSGIVWAAEVLHKDCCCRLMGCTHTHALPCH